MHICIVCVASFFAIHSTTAMSDSVSGTKRRADQRTEAADEDAADVSTAANQPSAKRPRTNGNDSTAIIAHAESRAGPDSYTALTIPGNFSSTSAVPSALLPSPLLSSYELLGHSAQVLTTCFHSRGQLLASGSRDKSLMLWRVPSRDDAGKPDIGCVSSMLGHKNAVTQIAWNNSEEHIIYSSSADKTGGMWDVNTGTRVRKLVGHTGIVNACSASRRGEATVATTDDNGFIKLWDGRSRAAIASFSDAHPLLAVEMADDANSLFTAGVEGVVKQWDLRKHTAVMTYEGHSDAVTGLSISPDGNSLLSFGMDNVLRAWDVRAFSAAENRCVKTFLGASNNFEQTLIRCSWGPGGDVVGCGSADRLLYVWDYETANVSYMLPGHNGVVTDMDFHPHYPIVASSSFDKKLMLGSLAPNATEESAEHNEE